MTSLGFYQAKYFSRSSRIGDKMYTDIFNAINPNLRTHDTRTTQKLLNLISGIEHVRYDICKNHCICYAGYPNARACPICNTPRHQLNGKPWDTFDYLPITHRIKLFMSHPSYAKKFHQYPYKLWKSRQPGILRDIWDGKLCDYLRHTRLLDHKRGDLGFFFSTDGVKLFSRGYFAVWPLILVNYNLPPSERFKEENLIIFGVIPGPKQPNGMNSYLRPLIDEFKILEKGIEVWDAILSAQRILHAYILVVGGDQPAREKLMGMMGQNSNSHCCYCLIKGVHNKHTYCPF